MQTSILSASPPVSLPTSTPLQSQVDGLVGGFVHHATDWRSLAAMTAGGFAYRAGRVGIMGLGNGHAIRALSVAGGLGAEVSVFELTHRSLQSVTLTPALSHQGRGGVLGIPSPLAGEGQGEGGLARNLWRWNGPGGIRQGLLQSLITFGALKSAGRLAAGENIVAQHLLQDSAMVLGHQSAAAFGIGPQPTGSLAEQFLHAEATNLQIGAGMALVHGMAPGMSGLERGLDVSLRGTNVGANLVFARRGGSPLQIGSQPALAGAGARGSSGTPYDLARETNILMSSSNEGGNIPPGGRPHELGAIPLRPNSEAETPRVPLVAHEMLNRLTDHRAYTSQLLRFTRDHFLSLIQEGKFSPRETDLAKSWLTEVEEVQRIQNQELAELGGALFQAEREGSLKPELTGEIKQGEAAEYSRLLRVHQQLERVREILSEYPTFQSAAELRRRLDWVFSLPEFAVEIDWRTTSLTDHMDPLVYGETDPKAIGLDLLIRLHPAFTPEDQTIYERAASGIIRGRDIAFDIDKTIGPVYAWHIAQTELQNNPQAYDGLNFNYYAHQASRMRLPYRGMQAMLMGLFIAGNRLKLYTAVQNVPNNLEAFLNDFPLLKVAFGLNPIEDPFRTLTTRDLYRSPNLMEQVKREEFHQRYFAHEDGQRFIRELSEEVGVRDLSKIRDSKMPFPEFPFDVLVDDLSDWAGEMQTYGFGRRWVEATGTTEAILTGLEQYFSRPLPETSPRMQTWLAGRTNSLTETKAPATLSSSKRGEVIPMEQGHLISIATRFRPHQSYFAKLGIDPELIQRALAPDGSLRDKATLLCEAAVKQYSQDNYGFHPERHEPLAKILEVLRNSDPLKKEVKAILASVPKEHVYNFLKLPLGPYFWMK